MRILIDIGHPAHVHYFKNLIQYLSSYHQITLTTKKNPLISSLLDYYGFKYILIGEKGEGVLRKAVKQVNFTMKICKIAQKQKIDLLIGVSVSIAQASKICGIPSIYFDDDDLKASPLTAYLGTPFATVILSPDSLRYEHTHNVVYYPGTHELSYLHPKRFTPNPEVLKKYGLSIDDKYYILRFNAFKAHHDINEGGMNLSQKHQLIKLLEQYGKVFITTESEIDPEFEQYRIPIAPYEMHSFLAYSQMLVSDSQTMSSEAAVLGVPSFRCNTFVGRISYLEEEEKRYGLTYGFLPRQFDWMLEALEIVLQDNETKAKWIIKRNRMLEDKIDVTAFWVWFIDNYPESVKEVKRRDFDFGRFK